MKKRAPRNRTLTCSAVELDQLSRRLVNLDAPTTVSAITGRIINQDLSECAQFLPNSSVDLLIVDPPYNLTKNYHGNLFRSKKARDYISWFDTTIRSLLHVLKPTATIYMCSDWQTSNLIFPVLDQQFIVRNRITWEREKGRGAKSNWKNNTEDIWFCTVGEDYFFNVDAVKLKRRVVAPYRAWDGKPKDWEESANGNYRLTHPSNIWSDITIPFWSMPENTDHPTQKPEKLIAKLVMASSRPDDFVLDPFLGSGTTAVVAKKLGRRFTGIEINTEYCCWSEKRLSRAESDSKIQGYADGVFWERNSLNDQLRKSKSEISGLKQGVLF
jgi:site-specific DNA-methyltransferase (adenine-specific)